MRNRNDEDGIIEYKGRKRKKKKAFLIILLVFILLTAGFFVFSKYMCILQDLSIDGIVYSEPNQVTDTILNRRFSDNAMFMFLDAFVEKDELPEFVDSISYSLTGLNGVHVQINEKEVAYFFTDEEGRYIYADSHGYVSAVSNRLIDEFLPVDGIFPVDSVVGTPVNIGDRERKLLLDVQREMKKLELEPIAIHFDENGYIMLDMGDYRINVGNDNLLMDKLSRLEYILPEIKGLRGTLHLETFSNDNKDIIFEKDTVKVEDIAE